MHVCTLLGWIEEKWIEECCELLRIGRVHVGLVWGFRDVTKPQTLWRAHRKSLEGSRLCSLLASASRGVSSDQLESKAFWGASVGVYKKNDRG